jgi:hypothetical protein
MRTKNKMKDFDAKSKEWWEVVEKNLAQHRANERSLSYKLKIYQGMFSNFVCGSPTSIETSNQDEENEVGSSRTTQEEEVQIEEP